MFRYVRNAFWARAHGLPLNAVALVAAAVAGWFQPEYWVAGGIAELVYLLTMSSNAGFRQWIDTRTLAALQTDTETARRKLLSNLGGAARQRYAKLEEKQRRLEQLSRDSAVTDDLLYDSNRDALRKLTWLFLQLLVAQRNLIVVAPNPDRTKLPAQIVTLEREISTMAPGPLRDSKTATARLLRERAENATQRDMSLAQIESDLARIEAQIDVALDETALRGRPIELSSNVELTSHLLSNVSGDSITTTSIQETER
ncbi:MAG: hypothetical protein ABIO78_07200 [Thermoanaerobaculia bacterium]